MSLQMRDAKILEDQLKKIALMRSQGKPDVDLYGAHRLSDTASTADGRLRFLVGLLLSAQTRDPVTAAAVARLDTFLPASEVTKELLERLRKCELKCPSSDREAKHTLTFENVRASSEEALREIIKPVGFYNKKAGYLKRICAENSDVPNTLKALCALPGVGPKMATIALELCYGMRVGIAVDTHVCRIAQRLGWAGKKDLSAPPEKVQKELEDWVPENLWHGFNENIVGFGQTWCTAKTPRCGPCMLRDSCFESEATKAAKK